MSVQLSAPADLPAVFRRAVAGLAGVELRPEVVISELPPPQRLAPFAVALNASVPRGDDDLADGRLIVLHDPDGQDVWEGTTRCVAYVQAEVDVEIASDPMLPSVGWSWLLDSLEAAGAQHCAAGGTVPGRLPSASVRSRRTPRVPRSRSAHHGLRSATILRRISSRSPSCCALRPASRRLRRASCPCPRHVGAAAPRPAASSAVRRPSRWASPPRAARAAWAAARRLRPPREAGATSASCRSPATT